MKTECISKCFIRVQRIPITEKKGRVHSSTAIVVVMLKESYTSYKLDKKDIRIDTYRSSGHGGQHVNKTESAVRVKHLPTGTTVCIQNERDQHENKKIALEKLGEKLEITNLQAFQDKRKQEHKKIMGTGDLSEKIRTYNWPDQRITDHRVKISLYGIDKMLNGQHLTKFIELLKEKERFDLIENLLN